jgi:hypothetical protein
VRPGAAAGLQQQHQQRLRQYQPHGQQQQRQPPQQQLRQLPGGMSGAPRQAHLQQPQQQQQQQPLPQLDPLQQQQQQHQPLPLPPQAPGWLQQVNVSVSQLLQGLGLGQFVPLLEQQQVDMAALQLLEERHLRELGLPIGAVVKIRAALSAGMAGETFGSEGASDGIIKWPCSADWSCCFYSGSNLLSSKVCLPLSAAVCTISKASCCTWHGCLVV